MPSQETAKKKDDLVEVVAVRKFACDYTKEELKEMQGKDKDKRSHVGLTKLIDKGESAFISKSVAQKLQDAGVIKVKL